MQNICYCKAIIKLIKLTFNMLPTDLGIGLNFPLSSALFCSVATFLILSSVLILLSVSSKLSIMLLTPADCSLPLWGRNFLLFDLKAVGGTGAMSFWDLAWAVSAFAFIYTGENLTDISMYDFVEVMGRSKGSCKTALGLEQNRAFQHIYCQLCFAQAIESSKL